MSVHDGSPYSLRGAYSSPKPVRDENTPERSGGFGAPSTPGSANRGDVGSAGGDAAARRRAAAEWVEAVAGTSLPYSSDHAFRAALRDGVLLCRLINSMHEGTVPQVLEAHDVEPSPSGLAQQRHHNVTSFLQAVQPMLPADAKFSLHDLESDGWEERPRITECLLHLRRLAEGGSQSASPSPLRRQPQEGMHDAMHLTPMRSSPGSGSGHFIAGSPQTPPVGAPSSPFGSAHGSADAHQHHQRAVAVRDPSAGMGLPRPYGLPGAAHAGMLAHPGAIQAAQTKSVQAAAGVTRLMQQCTAMLRDRMYHDAAGGAVGAPRGAPAQRYALAAPASPDTALEAMGPVLESVLGSLTQEYEKRLLAKDHELGHTRDAAAALQKQVYTLQGENGRLRAEMEAAHGAAQEAAAAATQADVMRLREELVLAQGAAQSSEGQLAALEASLDSASRAKAAREVALDAEVAALREQLAEVAELEGRYLRVVDENRRLYNTVQDLRGAIRVFCRIRPPGATGDASPSCIDVGVEGDLAVYDPNRGGERKQFRVDCIFDPLARQEAVYVEAQPLIRSVLDGYNVCIFAYGQTGSGKTHTMSGTNVDTEMGQGINYRALNDLFSIRDARCDEMDYSIRVQMLEIYNENLRDLLVRGGGTERLDILSTQASGCNVPGARQIGVGSADEVAAIMARGAANRHTSETKMNDRSSRSHQILTVIVDGMHRVSGARSHGCLHLIDLAGSERVSKSEASGDRLVEAQHINRSLSALGDVMAALASKNNHVPFRNSKLTQLLQDSLSGQAKVMMFMHISPEINMYGETISTLKFASRVSEITLGQAKRNVESGRVFEAHEAAAAAQQALAEREAQASQAAEALHAERCERAALAASLDSVAMDRDSLAREVGELRAQLEVAKKAAMMAAKQQHQQHSPAPRQLSPTSLSHTPHVSALLCEPGRSPMSVATGASSTPAAAMSVLRHVPKLPLDRSPMRDQDAVGAHDNGQLSARARQVSPLAGTPADTPPLRTPRGSLLPVRECSSSQRHVERLNMVRLRQSSSFQSGALAAAAAAAVGATAAPPPASKRESLGSYSARQPRTAADAVSTQSSGASRPRTAADGSGALTARGAATTTKARAYDLAASTLTSRQSGVFRASMAMGPATTRQGAGAAAMGSATARAGGRWK